jgi:hypothetical protein
MRRIRRREVHEPRQHRRVDDEADAEAECRPSWKSDGHAAILSAWST